MCNKRILYAAVLLMLISATPALAHNLILEAYPFGGAITGEAFFSDGILVGDATIEVIDEAGVVIGRATTDTNGGFSYAPTQGGEHRFRLDAGAGHVAEVLISTEAIAPLVGEPAAEKAEATSDMELEALSGVQLAIEREMGGLRQQFAEYRAHNDMLNLAATGGLLAGLLGLMMFLVAGRIASTLPEKSSMVRKDHEQWRAAQ